MSKFHPTKRDVIVFTLTFIFDVIVWEAAKKLVID